MANDDFDALLSTTLKNYIAKLEDNVFSARPLLAWLKRKDHIKSAGGGVTIVEPLVHGLNSTAGSYAGYDTIPTTPQEGISAAEYPWKQFAASIAIAGIEESINSGEQRVLNLLEAKTMQAEETIAEKLDEMLFLDGTGNSSKDFLGLAAVVAATGTVGGIDKAANTFWQSYVESTAEPLTLGKMARAFYTASKGNDRSDFVLSTLDLFLKYESLLQPQLRYSDPKTADAGFENLLFHTAPVMYDVYAQSGVMYFLNSKYLRIRKLDDKWFSTTPFKQPEDQDARYAQILVYGNLTASNCARQAKLTAKTV